MREAVVTGATGHLGNVLVRELLSRGARVRALVQPGDDLRPLAGLDVEHRTGDVLDPPSLRRAFDGAHTVFHLAGVVSIGARTAPLLRRVNVDGTANVLDACRATGVARLVWTGSVQALPEPPPGGTLDETAGFHPERTVGPYGRSKAEAARLVVAAARAGLDAVLVLPTGVLGPWDYRLSEVGELFTRHARGRLFAVVAGGYDFVDVRDVAVGHVLAAERGRRGESYLLAGGHLDIARAARRLARLSGRPPPRVVLPLWAARLAAAPMPLWEAVSGRRVLLTRCSVHTLGARFTVDDSKARRELGWASRPHEQSLLDTWLWMTKDPDSPLARGGKAPGPGRVPRTAPLRPLRAQGSES